jgi:hypothetical protein
MAKISRADWAATTPWEGITNKPATFGATDIGQLTGHGYSSGQVPVYNAASGRFLPGSRNPSPTPTPPDPTPGIPTEIAVDWDVGNLHALQTATEDFDFVGAFPGHPVIVGASYTNDFVQISATVVDLNVVRISVTNMGIDDLDLDDGFYRLRIFTDV